MASGDGIQSAVRVLIADADPGIRRQIRKRLLDAGIYSDAVPDARAALERMVARPYALILVDLALPMAGAERMLEAVAQMAAGERPVVLVLADGPVTRSLDVEIVQIILRKPCNLTNLAELVQSCVRTSALHRSASLEEVPTEELSAPPVPASRPSRSLLAAASRGGR